MTYKWDKSGTERVKSVRFRNLIRVLFMEVIASMIKKFGLNTSEAKVYVALLVLHDAKASEIAKQAGVPRNKLYEVAESLNKKGFVEIIPEKVMKFRAVPFEAVCDMHMKSWQQQMDEIDKTKKDIMQRLKNISEPHDEKSYFAVLRSRKVIRKRLEDIMQSSDRVLLMINISDMRYLVNFAKKATKNKELNVIVPVNRDSMPLVKKWMRFADVRHYQTSMQEKIAVTGDSVLIFEFGTPLALYSTDPKFVSMFRSFLEAEWSAAVPAETKLKEIETGKPAEEMVFMRGMENLYRLLPGFISETKKDLIVITSKNGVVRLHKYLNEHLKDALARGVKIRVITNLTKENIGLAKAMAAEVRHVDKVYAVAGCYDESRLVMIDIKSDMPTKSSPEDVVLITTNTDTVKMMRQMLESVWEDAIPLETRIAELEGRRIEEMKVIYGKENIYQVLREITTQAEKEICILSTEGTLERSMIEGTFDLGKNLSKKVKRRYILPITKRNVSLVKNAMEFAEVRHTDFTPIRIRMVDSERCTIRFGGDDIVYSQEMCVFSNMKSYVSSIKEYFEKTWAEAIPAEDRIAEIETGKPREETYYLHGRQKLYRMMPQVIQDTKHDIIWTTSEIGLVRIYENLRNIIDEHKNRLRIRCLAPVTKANIEFAKKLGIEIRHIDKVYAVADCYDDSVAVVINPKDDDISNDEVMVTNKQEMVKMMRQMLESMWQRATPLEDREKELESRYTEKELAESIALEKMYDQTGNDLSS